LEKYQLTAKRISLYINLDSQDKYESFDAPSILYVVMYLRINCIIVLQSND